jgi:alpha-tubulin suppressor-like RCC1 family protein/outer membrane protein assembly factor BamB
MQFAHRWANRLTPVLLAAALPLVAVASTPAQAAVAEPQFAPYRTYPVPSSGQSVAIADFTGDGRNDVLVNTAWTNSPDNAFKLYLYAQTTAGVLEQRAAYDTTPQNPQYTPTSLAAGDLNGDGRADAVVATMRGLDVFLQDDAGLGARLVVPLEGTFQVEMGDIDGDGHADVVANGSTGVSWLRGAGDGTLGPALPISPAVQAEIEVGDVTGDGRLDVVGFQLFDNGGDVFRQLPDGGFAPTNYDFVGKDGIAVGDLTGDGLLDLVSTVGNNSPGGAVMVLPQRLDHGLGPAAVYDSYDIPGPVEVGDLNGDGRADVVTLHEAWAKVGVYLQDTDGTLTTERLFPAPYGQHTKKALDIGDVTGDGRADVVWAEGGGLVVLAALAPLPPTTTTTTTMPPGSTTTTTTTLPPPPVDSDESTTYQVDAGHSGRVAGGNQQPPLEKRWTRDLGGIVSHPLVADGRVFALARTAFHYHESTLFALDADTGEDLWGPLDMGNDAWFGYGDGQVFVVNADGVLRSFDAATGRQRWIVGADFQRVTSPPVYHDGAVWYHAYMGAGGALYGFSADDGHPLGSWPAGMGEDSIPAVSDDFVYSSHECDPLQAISPDTVRMVWSYGRQCSGGWRNYTPVLAEGLVWVRGIATRPPTALDDHTGARIVTFATDAAPAFDDGRGYFLNHGVLEARDPRTQQPLWSFGDGTLTVAPIVVNGYVYVASAAGQVWALDGPTGAVAWTGAAGAPVLPPGEVDSRPELVGLAAGQGVVMVPATNLLVAFGPQGGTASASASGSASITAAAAAAATPPRSTAASSTVAGPPSDEAVTPRIGTALDSRIDSGRETAPLAKRWTRDLGYPVKYSLLAEGKVFAAAGPYLYALDAATGEDAWGPIALGPVYEYAGSNVTYGDGRVFANYRGGPLRAFDASTGADLWTTGFDANETVGVPPVYEDGIVYTLSHDTLLRAVSAATGRVLWTGLGGRGSTQMPSIDGGRVYVAATCRGAFAVDAFSGAEAWRHLGVCGSADSMGSAVAGGRLWNEGSWNDTPVTYDASTGKLTGAFAGTVPAFADDRYFVLHGTALKGKDAATDFTLWSFTGDGQLATSPVVVDGLVYVGSATGKVWALDPSTGTPVWEGDAGAPISPRHEFKSQDLGVHIAAGQGLVVVPATNTLVAFAPVAPPAPLVHRPLAWGWNVLNQLGDGSNVDRNTAVPMAGLTDVVQIAAGAYHDLALRADGTVWATGWNGLGQLGDGTKVSRSAPVQVTGLTDMAQVAVGAFHSVALKKDGTVWAWGWNGMGQVGDGTTAQRLTPVKVAQLTDVTQVAVGLVHNLAVKKDGSVWSWGYNGLGQLGDGGTVEQHTPVRARDLAGVVSVGAGSYHSLAVKQDGTVVTWGWNNLGQLGDGTTVNHAAPRVVPGLAHVVGVTGGLYHSLAVHDDGRVSAWGWNALGQLGDGTTVDRPRPVEVPGLRGATAVTAGFYTSLARTNDGRVLGWGWNGYGQLGDGTVAGRPTPQHVPSVFGVRTLASGAFHSVAA